MTNTRAKLNAVRGEKVSALTGETEEADLLDISTPECKAKAALLFLPRATEIKDLGGPKYHGFLDRTWRSVSSVAIHLKK